MCHRETSVHQGSHRPACRHCGWAGRACVTPGVRARHRQSAGRELETRPRLHPGAVGISLPPRFLARRQRGWTPTPGELGQDTPCRLLGGDRRCDPCPRDGALRPPTAPGGSRRRINRERHRKLRHRRRTLTRSAPDAGTAASLAAEGSRDVRRALRRNLSAVLVSRRLGRSLLVSTPNTRRDRGPLRRAGGCGRPRYRPQRRIQVPPVPNMMIPDPGLPRRGSGKV